MIQSNVEPERLPNYPREDCFSSDITLKPNILLGAYRHPKEYGSLYVLCCGEADGHLYYRLTLPTAIAVACRDSDVRNVKALIIGPPETPYEFGFFDVGGQVIPLVNELLTICAPVQCQISRGFKTHPKTQEL